MSETKEDSFRDSYEEDVQEHLRRVSDTLGIPSPACRMQLGTKMGDNYVSVVYRVTIEGEKNGLPVKIQTIFKLPPKDEVMRLTLLISNVFEREHVLYSEIVPVFNKFLQTKDKSLENVPRCYFSSALDHKEVICLEDLRPKGFVMRDRIKQMDFPHMSLAFRALGRFHALSFALRDQRTEVFARKITTLEEALFSPEVIADPRFISRFQRLGDLVKTALAEEDSSYTERFSVFLNDGLNHMESSCQGSAAEPYSVLCHGDFWMNNLLFKYEEDSLEPQDIYLLDFQNLRYASPALDISYILFCNCSQELRTRHFDELIRIYHESLSDYLSELGSDPKKLFPYEALLSQLRKFSIYSAGMTLMLLPMFTSQGDDVREFIAEDGELPALEKRIHRDDFWRNTARDTLKDLIDRNYL